MCKRRYLDPLCCDECLRNSQSQASAESSANKTAQNSEVNANLSFDDKSTKLQINNTTSVTPFRKELMLINMSIFSERPDYFGKVADDIDFKTYPLGHVMQEENQKVAKICWIVDGSCSVSRSIPLWENIKTGKLSKPIPGSEFDADLTLKWFQLETQQLVAGDWFPMIPGQTSVRKSNIPLRDIDIEKEKSKFCVMAVVYIGHRMIPIFLTDNHCLICSQIVKTNN